MIEILAQRFGKNGVMNSSENVTNWTLRFAASSIIFVAAGSIASGIFRHHRAGLRRGNYQFLLMRTLNLFRC